MQEEAAGSSRGYAQDNDIRATHASNTVNKWISETLGIQKTPHSFRHSMKDLLRNVGCPDDIQRQLLGQGSKVFPTAMDKDIGFRSLPLGLRKLLISYL